MLLLLCIDVLSASSVILLPPSSALLTKLLSAGAVIPWCTAPISWWLGTDASSSAAFALVPLLLSQQALDYLSKVISAAGVALLLALEMAMVDYLHLPSTKNLRAAVRGAVC